MQSVFSQLILDVRNVDASVGFYRDSLGLDVFKTDEFEGHRLAYMTSDGFELLLLEQPNRDQMPPALRGGGVVMNFRVSNLPRLAETLKKERIDVLRDLDDPSHGDRTLLIADPDGYSILLSEPVAGFN